MIILIGGLAGERKRDVRVSGALWIICMTHSFNGHRKMRTRNHTNSSLESSIYRNTCLVIFNLTSSPMESSFNNRFIENVQELWAYRRRDLIVNLGSGLKNSFSCTIRVYTPACSYLTYNQWTYHLATNMNFYRKCPSA